MKLLLGLTSAEAASRHQALGANEIVPSKFESRFSEIQKVLFDPMGLMLLLLAGLYALLGDKSDAIVLLIAYIPVTAVDVFLEVRSQKALAALKATLKLTSKVLRDGQIREIPSREIVVGDILAFEEGQSLPADGHVIDCHLLMADESALTGESVPVEKLKQDPFFGGTTLIQGRGLGLVEKIGPATRFGKIASLLHETQTQKSPLQNKINHLLKGVIYLALVLVILLFLLNYARTQDLLQSLLVALTFGMAAIPEEFPLVFTLYLSMGAWRLAKHGVLIKSLPSVEALGSVDVICTDKTGTLTEGQFQLEELLHFETKLPKETLWTTALMACETQAVDAMELAIYSKAEREGYKLTGWSLKWDYPFELEGKHMSHVWESQRENETRLAMKGAVEGVLAHCQLHSQRKAELLQLVDKLAGQGKRLLGLAYRQGPCTGERSHDEQDLTFIGLLVFSDPIRASTSAAILACQVAGIEVKMLTGDHPLTAHAVADETGIIHSHQLLFTGDQLASLPIDARFLAYQQGAIFSRVQPEQKYEMVQALKKLGKVVAMTGDGINDAPALKLADIGISMGARATDVARSSAQMLLLKNDFGGIVQAVFEGRQIFANLKRSFSYLISFHIPIILLTLIPSFWGWTTLLLPIHIILLELIVHPVSAFTFENLKGNREKSKKELLSLRQICEASLSGLLLSIICLMLYHLYSQNTGTLGATLALATLLFGNIGFICVESWPLMTRRLGLTVLILFSLALMLLYLPLMNEIFHLQRPTPLELLLTLGLGLMASVPNFILRTKSR